MPRDRRGLPPRNRVNSLRRCGIVALAAMFALAAFIFGRLSSDSPDVPAQLSVIVAPISSIPAASASHEQVAAPISVAAMAPRHRCSTHLPGPVSCVHADACADSGAGFRAANVCPRQYPPNHSRRHAVPQRP